MTKQCPSCGGDCGRTAKSGCWYNTSNPKVPKFEVCDTSELSEVLRLTALLGEERTISDALALRVDELKAELGDLPEAQREMMAEIKRLKAELASSRVGFNKVSPYEPGSRGRFSI